MESIGKIYKKSKEVIKDVIGEDATKFVSENKAKLKTGLLVGLIAGKSMTALGTDAPKNFNKLEKKTVPTAPAKHKTFETPKDSLSYTLDQYENDIETHSRDTSAAEGDFRKWAESFKSIVGKKLESSSPAFKAEFQELMNLPALKYKLNALVNAVPETNHKKAEKRRQEIKELQQKVDDLHALWGQFSRYKLGTYTAANTFYYLPGQTPEDPDGDLHVILGHHLSKMEAALRALDEENDEYREAQASIPEIKKQLANLNGESTDPAGPQTAQK